MFTIFDLIRRIKNKISVQLWRFFFSFKQGLYLGDGVIFKGKPMIDIRNGGKIIIKNKVTLNSKNYGYHLNMNTPVKLFADRPEAKITICEKTRIHGSCIHAYSSIHIGSGCLIAANCQIFDASGHSLSFDDVSKRIDTKGDSHPIFINDFVWIGANSLILPGVTIGKGSIIGAGSVVTNDVPPYVIAAGNPARVVKTGGRTLEED